MRYSITLKQSYDVTEDDLEYLYSVGLKYERETHSISTLADDIDGYKLERVKGDIRRIPNQALYDNLVDDLKSELPKPKPKPRIIVKYKSKNNSN